MARPFSRGLSVSAATSMGHAIDRDVAELVAALAGTDLARLFDAIERLGLFAGAAQPITEQAVCECVAPVRPSDPGALVDAVGKRDLGRALALLADVYDSRDRGLPLLGALAWSIRQLARFPGRGGRGASTDERRGAPGIFQPHRAREIAQKGRALRARELERWLLVLADTDIALKSSRRAPDAILEDMLTRLCRPRRVA